MVSIAERQHVFSFEDRPEIIAHERRLDGWKTSAFGEGMTATLSAIRAALPLTEVYENLPDV